MRTPRAFTLVELLVTIGIIALLAGIALVASFKVMGTGRRVRAQADLQAISTAIEAYKQDFGDYPRAIGTGPESSDGAWLLAATLAAPAGASADGADGMGFRTRPGGQGRIYGPYIDVDKFNVRSDTTLTPSRYYLVDKNFSPGGRQNPAVLYIPRNIKSTITPAERYVGDNTFMYNATAVNDWASNSDVWPPLGSLAAGTQMRIAMGDKNGNGVIGNGETPAFTGPYVLWMAGPDGMFGLTNGQGKRGADDGTYASDDIANFDFDPIVTVK